MAVREECLLTDSLEGDRGRDRRLLTSFNEVHTFSFFF